MSYINTNYAFLSIFIKRWNIKLPYFHLPIGEKTPYSRQPVMSTVLVDLWTTFGSYVNSSGLSIRHTVEDLRADIEEADKKILQIRIILWGSYEPIN